LVCWWMPLGGGGWALVPFRALLEACVACAGVPSLWWRQEDARRRVLGGQLRERVQGASQFLGVGDGLTRVLADAWTAPDEDWEGGELGLPSGTVEEVDQAFARVVSQEGGDGVVVCVADRARRPLALVLGATWPWLRVVSWSEVEGVARQPDAVVTLSNTEAWLS